MGHTPGPWAKQITAGDHGYNIYDEGDGPTIAHVYGGENEANARLIAAAPQLLEALEALAGRTQSATSMLNSLGYPSYYADAEPYIRSARAAIAAARGDA